MAYLVAVGLGGFVGAILRYAIAGGMQKAFPQFLPAGTLAVNALGCFAIGFLMAIVIAQSQTGQPGWMSHSLRLFLITGILGGFTTFSAFGYETVELLREDQFPLAVLNVSANVGLGLPAVWLGGLLAKTMGY